jgi:membrane protease YdiL (CAAX protease family)
MAPMNELDPPGPGPLGGPAPGPALGGRRHVAEPAVVPASPEPPERADGAPRWPFWHGLAAMALAAVMLVALTIPTLLVARLLGVATARPGPAFTVALTILNDAVLVGCAVGVAALTVRPRLRHFGLRATPLWPAVGFCALGIGTYFVFGGVFGLLYPDQVRQTTLDKLGAGESTVALVAIGVLLVVVAPLVEEFFFRGFLYRSLRTRLPIPLAALLGGAVFGSVHLSTGAAATLPLSVLGVTFCLIVERTGSLYPVIALHAIVNALAYSVSPEAPDGSATVALPLLAAMLAGCLLLPRLARRSEVPGPVEPAPAPV